MSPSKPILYLAHPILSRESVREWELKTEKEIGIDLKNPFYDGKGYENGNIQKVDSGEMDVYDRRFDAKLLVETDLDTIDSCDGILAICDENLSIGTSMEIMYAKLHSFPVIAICTSKRTNAHPWIRYCSDEIFFSFNAFSEWANLQYKDERKGIRVGLAGKSRSGKDIVAQMLSPKFIFAFSDELKNTTKRVFGFSRNQILEKPEIVRKTLQNFGTEAVRNIFPNAWVTCLQNRLEKYEKVFPKYGIAVADVRFFNEEEMLRKNGYKIVRIFRPDEDAGHGALHISETELDNIEMDCLIVNNGTKDQLKKKVIDLRTWLGNEGTE